MSKAIFLGLTHMTMKTKIGNKLSDDVKNLF